MTETERIKNLIEALKSEGHIVDEADLARKTGISKSLITEATKEKGEKGYRDLSAVSKNKILDAFDFVNRDYIYGRVDNPIFKPKEDVVKIQSELNKALWLLYETQKQLGDCQLELERVQKQGFINT